MEQIIPDSTAQSPRASKPESKVSNEDKKKARDEALKFLRQQYETLKDSLSSLPEPQRTAELKLLEMAHSTAKLYYHLNATFNEFHDERFSRLEQAFSALEKKVNDSVLFKPEVTKLTKEIKEELAKMSASEYATAMLNAAKEYLAEDEEGSRKVIEAGRELIRSPRTAQILAELMSTPEAEEIKQTLLKSARENIKKFVKKQIRRPVVYIPTIAATLVLVGALGLSVFNFFRKYETYTVQTSEASTKVDEIEKILKEGPQTPEEEKKLKGLSTHLVPEGKYVKQNNLDTTLQLYSTSEELEDKFSDIKTETDKIPRIKQDYNDLLTRVGNAEELVRSRPTSEAMASADNTLEEDLTREIDKLKQDYEVSSKENKKARADYEEKLASLIQRLSKLEDEKQKQNNLQLQQDLEFLFTPRKLELYPTSQSLSLQLLQSQPSPELFKSSRLQLRYKPPTSLPTEIQQTNPTLQLEYTPASQPTSTPSTLELKHTPHPAE